jgi:hypothetical protein
MKFQLRALEVNEQPDLLEILLEMIQEIGPGEAQTTGKSSLLSKYYEKNGSSNPFGNDQ